MLEGSAKLCLIRLIVLRKKKLFEGYSVLLPSLRLTALLTLLCARVSISSRA